MQMRFVPTAYSKLDSERSKKYITSSYNKIIIYVVYDLENQYPGFVRLLAADGKKIKDISLHVGRSLDWEILQRGINSYAKVPLDGNKNIPKIIEECLNSEFGEEFCSAVWI